MEKFQIMSLLNCRTIITNSTAACITDSQLGVDFTYLFMAKRMGKGSEVIEMKLWVFLRDWQGFSYQHFGVHMGNYKDWKEAIINRVEKCLLVYGVNKLQVKRLIREFEPSKNKLIKWDANLNDIMHY